MADRDPSKYFFRDRWSATDAPTAGSAASAVSPALVPTQRQHLETIWYSIWNSNAASTIQAQVRVASVAGTVLASVDHQVNTSTVANVGLFGLGIPGKRGQKFFVTFNTAVASLTTKVNIAGWTEDANG